MEKVYTEHLDPHAVVIIATTFEQRERSVCLFCGLG
jgi:hypothetical protein